MKRGRSSVIADHDAVNTSTSSHDHQHSPPDGASVSTDEMTLRRM